jgi:hypothetical protein
MDVNKQEGTMDVNKQKGTMDVNKQKTVFVPSCVLKIDADTD